MSDTTAQAPADREFVGYRQAAEYLGIAKSTLNAYMGRGYGPPHRGRRVVGQYVQYVFAQSDLDEWKLTRPGQGARTDRMHAGAGRACPICTGLCELPAT